jgi:hypothetical protein
VELATIPDEVATGRIIHDVTAWAKKLKVARNELAHANPRSDNDDDDSALAIYLLEVTYALLALVLMAELRLDAEAQRTAADNSGILWASLKFNEIVASEASVVEEPVVEEPVVEEPVVEEPVVEEP